MNEHRLDFQVDQGMKWEETPVSLTVVLSGPEADSQIGNLEFGYAIGKMLAQQLGFEVRFVIDQQPGTSAPGHYCNPKHNDDPKRKRGKVNLSVRREGK